MVLFPDTQLCDIWCVDYTGSAPSNYGALPDGTPCSYNKPYDICFQVRPTFEKLYNARF